MKKSFLPLGFCFSLGNSLFIASVMLPFAAWGGEVEYRDRLIPKTDSNLVVKVAQGERAKEEGKAGRSELVPMTVTGAADASVYQMDTSTAGSEFPLEIDRVPQSIQVITEDAFEDQGAQSIGDIMKQVPSANVFGSRFGRFPSITIRGFSTEQIRNGMGTSWYPARAELISIRKM